MVEVSRVELKAGSGAKVWKVRAATAVSVIRFDSSTMLWSFVVLFSLPVLCSDSSKLTNTSEGSYFALWRLMPLTKIASLITLVLLACLSWQCHILILLFLLTRCIARLCSLNAIV